MCIPRIDPHRHLGGSIPDEFVWQTIRDLGLTYLAESHDEVRRAMTFEATEARTFHRFLDKFRLLDSIPWTEELIDDSIRCVADELKRSGTDYCWMRFSVNKYMDAGIKWHRHHAIKFIHDSFRAHLPGGVGLMLSLKYESARAGQRQLAKLISDDSVAESVIGIDLVGDEGHFNSEFYAPIMRDWRAAGKVCCAHVGESQSADNVWDAIKHLNVTNVAHGFKIWDRPDIISLARDRNVCFDMALSSNYITGTWQNQNWHPIRKLVDSGLDCTIGTDDPIQISLPPHLYGGVKPAPLTLRDEFGLLRSLGFTADEADAVALTAVRKTADLGVDRFQDWLHNNSNRVSAA